MNVSPGELVAARFDDVGEFPRNDQPALIRKG
jgi:hypothetical protein